MVGSASRVVTRPLRAIRAATSVPMALRLVSDSALIATPWAADRGTAAPPVVRSSTMDAIGTSSASAASICPLVGNCAAVTAATPDCGAVNATDPSDLMSPDPALSAMASTYCLVAG